MQYFLLVRNYFNGTASHGNRNKMINCAFCFSNEIVLKQFLLVQHLSLLSYRSSTFPSTWHMMGLVLGYIVLTLFTSFKMQLGYRKGPFKLPGR